MATTLNTPSDFQCGGQGSFASLYVSNAFVTDRYVILTAGAGAGIQAAKLQHQYEKQYSIDGTTSAISERRLIHYVRGQTGTIVEFLAGAMVLLTGADTCTVDLWVNGLSVLSPVISLLSTDTAGVGKLATVNAAALAVGNRIEVRVVATHSTGTLPQGVFAQCGIREDAQ
jgi:hypothetical protein